MQEPPYWDRFWDKVRPEGDCWAWTAGRTRGGYGKFKLNGRTVVAHRVAYELLVSPIPEGLVLDHLCRVRHCVNPSHLEPVTMRENLRRGFGFVGENARKTHCNRGHSLSGENLMIRDGSRWCLTCKRRRDRDNQRRYRAAARK